ncbi:MAG: hypothetical protein CMI58_02790 [Parcubacteria group bacterium]|jgi:4-hydroxybenzoate polyprenyltransferase|nr:hypothetical protein [Parcubacteria group bacterium]|tara:strand:- start:2020 stop:2853 length:834 start_codon:yes stop_codon:yes gene_type:complete
MIFHTLELIRVKDWIKNLVLLMPLIFSGNILNFDVYLSLFISLIFFSLTTSAVYIINDINDIKSDRSHPYKIKTKPIARGDISLNYALGLLIFIFILITIFYFIDSKIIFHLLAYFILNLFYNYFIKGIIILDLFIISIGYIIRIDVGSIAIGVQSSMMMLISIFSLSFFVLAIKRKKEFQQIASGRKNLKHYNLTILNSIIALSLFSSIVSYSIYIYIKNHNLIISMPLVIICFLRYLYISSRTSKGEFPFDLFFRDWILLLSGCTYMVVIVINFL